MQNNSVLHWAPDETRSYPGRTESPTMRMEEKVDFCSSFKACKEQSKPRKDETFTRHRVNFLLEGLKYFQSPLTGDGKELAMPLKSPLSHISVASVRASRMGNARCLRGSVSMLNSCVHSLKFNSCRATAGSIQTGAPHNNEHPSYCSGTCPVSL